MFAYNNNLLRNRLSCLSFVWYLTSFSFSTRFLHFSCRLVYMCVLPFMQRKYSLFDLHLCCAACSEQPQIVYRIHSKCGEWNDKNKNKKTRIVWTVDDEVVNSKIAEMHKTRVEKWNKMQFIHRSEQRWSSKHWDECRQRWHVTSFAVSCVWLSQSQEQRQTTFQLLRVRMYSIFVYSRHA